jgi:pimeloyl-ACP methyl ester carboxylesterase
VEYRSNAKLILIHALGGNKDSYQFVPLDRIGMQPGGVYEYPGHGGRPRQASLTFAWMADELVQMFDGDLHLVGVAVGASIAAQALVRHPERITSAVLVNGSGGRSAPPSPEQQQVLIDRGEGALNNGMRSVIDDTFGRWFTLHARLSDPPGVQYARKTLLAMDPGGWADIWRTTALSEPVPPDRLRGITQPVSIVSGLQDGSVRGAAGLHALIPNSRLHYTAGPHMLHLERPRNLLAAIEQHFIWASIGAGRIEAPYYFTGE